MHVSRQNRCLKNQSFASRDDLPPPKIENGRPPLDTRYSLDLDEEVFNFNYRNFECPILCAASSHKGWETTNHVPENASQAKMP